MSGLEDRTGFRMGSGTKKQRKWTQAEVALVQHLYASGRTFSQIACNLGVGKGAIASLLNRHPQERHALGNQITRWRVKQLLISDYSIEQSAEMTGARLEIAQSVFDEIHKGELK